MDVMDAVEKLNHVTLWPEWRLIATDYTKRHESGVKLRLEYEVRNSDAEYGPTYSKWVHPFAYAEFCIQVGDIAADEILYARTFAVVLRVVEHELREFFGVESETDAPKPFHPHTIVGMANWQQYHGVARPDYSDTIQSDVTFGSV
jgi:hypothetical protein